MTQQTKYPNSLHSHIHQVLKACYVLGTILGTWKKSAGGIYAPEGIQTVNNNGKKSYRKKKVEQS